MLEYCLETKLLYGIFKTQILQNILERISCTECIKLMTRMVSIQKPSREILEYLLSVCCIVYDSSSDKRRDSSVTLLMYARHYLSLSNKRFVVKEPKRRTPACTAGVILLQLHRLHIHNCR